MLMSKNRFAENPSSTDAVEPADNADFAVSTASANDTRLLGQALGSCLRAGDVVLLTGDLGAGKTQFVQGAAGGLHAAEVPISPTFNIVLTYGSGRLPLHHFDLYRLDDAEQLEDIGLREYLESGGACFVEWAEKFPQAFDEFLGVELRKVGDEARLVVAHARGERPQALLGEWRRAWQRASEEDAGDGAARCGRGEVSRVATSLADEASPVDASPPSVEAAPGQDEPCVLAFDTANEVVALAVGVLDARNRDVRALATREVRAHRASNTQLLPQVDALLAECGVRRGDIACVCVGRGPGSFTGVRIAMATAKGVAQALGVGLVGVSTLDAIAWNAQAAGVRGRVLVVADAMRKEVYPAWFDLDDDSAHRRSADRVVKAEDFARELESSDPDFRDVQICGDGLVKYLEELAPFGTVLSDGLWDATGRGLLLALRAAWRNGDADPLDATRHDPAFALPVYTRLSDAEEHERTKLALGDERNLKTGVRDLAPDGGVGRQTMHATAVLAAVPDRDGVVYRPLAASDAPAVAALEARALGSDAWSERLVADELSQRDRSWWVAEHAGRLVGYAGGLVVDGDLQVLKVAVEDAWRRLGIARTLLAHLAEDARNLGASTCSLEVRASNDAAQAFYAHLGLVRVGVRPRYYSDGEDAAIMQGPLPLAAHDVAGMHLQRLQSDEGPAAGDTAACIGPADSAKVQRLSESEQPPAPDSPKAQSPVILAIESSCDETAAAVVDGRGVLRSDIVASQIDFHARFGGVVPEIASRKHIEAICGVCAEALQVAGVDWCNLDAVGVTYAPGLVGALVVGVAFAKGAAWALDVPFVGVNHLEGHLYANKIGAPDFQPPAVVSLVSGGNTMLVHMRAWGDYETLGATIDDAVGEAFDKVAKALGLGYPGGPVISRQASCGNPEAIDFPRAMLHSHDLRFSLSGLKTAVVNYINKERQAGRQLNVPDIAASFQQAVVDVQVAKAETALKQTGAPTFCLGGGVAANPMLRAAYERLCRRLHVRLVMPPLSSCGDNAGMIALVALDRYRTGAFFDLSADAYAHANLDEPY